MKDFIKIAITRPGIFEGEADIIHNLIDSGEVDFVHIRKPGANIEIIKNLLDSIPVRYHRQLKIHDYFELINEYDLGGIHLNSRNPEPFGNPESLSISCHSIEQLDSFEHYSYMTLSPIYDSISKPGYVSQFRLDELRKHIEGKRIVALGGVTPEKFHELKKSGFYGAAMLGYYFKR